MRELPHVQAAEQMQQADAVRLGILFALRGQDLEVLELRHATLAAAYPPVGPKPAPQEFFRRAE